jgi:predicted metal-dependent peptidase
MSNPIDYTEVEKALSKVKIRMMMEPATKFYSTILFSLIIEFTDRIPTASVNGVTMCINPGYFIGLTIDERLSLVLHEVSHVAYNHMARKGTRDHASFNIAGDHVINLGLLAAGYRLHHTWLQDAQYKGMNTEQVYEKVKSDPPPPDYDQDVVFAAPGNQKAVADKVANIVIRASILAKQAGCDPGLIPAEIGIALDKHINPKLPWHVILQNHLSSFAPDDYTMKRLNRKYFPEFYLPTLYNEAICDLVVAVDASGSVEDHEFSHFIHEIHKIRETMQPKNMTVLDFDTRIKTVHKLDHTVNVLKDIKFTGRGGTAIQPVLSWIDKQKPEVALIFTDGEFALPSVLPKIPIIWLIHGNYPFKPSLGRVIRYEIERK